MPSPFPGMDPFLEDRLIFPDFHDGFIFCLREAIQPQLPEPYYAALGRRAWVEITEPILVKIPHDEQTESLIEIYMGRGSERRLVTSIEVLSPSNKTQGERGRELYIRKQKELLDSKTHLVEIDLLRGGLHTTAVNESWLKHKVPKFDYHACVHPFDTFEDFYIYPIQLPDCLPSIRIPLLNGDDDVPVNLQQVFERTYSAGPYHREIDYHDAVPPPHLSTEAQTWLNEQIKSAEQLKKAAGN